MEELKCPRCKRPVTAEVRRCDYCGGRQPVRKVVTPEQPPAGGTGADPYAESAESIVSVQLAVSSPNGSRSVPLGVGDLIEIGTERGPLVDLCTDNISRRHAELRVGQTSVEVTDRGTDDTGSTNGTFVDGVRLPPMQPTIVSDGSVVTCGADPPLTIRIAIVGS